MSHTSKDVFMRKTFRCICAMPNVWTPIKMAIQLSFLWGTVLFVPWTLNGCVAFDVYVGSGTGFILGIVSLELSRHR